MKLKKFVSILCVIVMAFSIGTITVFADETGAGAKILINNDNPSFEELICVENGKTYLPLRLVFPNLNDKDNKIGMTISWGRSYPVIHLIHGATTGGDPIDGAAPYEGVRNCVDIMWEGDASNGAKAYLTVIKYTYDENGEMNIVEHDESQILDDLVYLKKVEDGDRMFVSIDDINKLTKLIGFDGAYSVKIYR